MLMPRRTKFRKKQRGINKGCSSRGLVVSQGDFGISVLEPGIITARQIESVRVTVMRCMKRGGKMYTMIFPDFPYTKKPSETRMGKGKGNFEEWVCKVKPGRLLFEISGVSFDIAKNAFRLASHKLPVKVKFLSKNLV